MNRFMLAVLTAAFILVGFSCGGKDREYAELLAEFEPEGYADRGASEEKIRELQKEIAGQKKIVKQTIDATYDIALHNKMLALEYIELKMYGPALDALKEALEISPVNRVLFYYAGVCSAQMSKTTPDPETRDRYLRDADFYYTRAIELKNNYVDALYAQAVLYAFEMDRLLEAESLLEEVLRYSGANTQAMFLLARINVQLGDVDRAIELYEEIEDISPFEEERSEAESNKGRLLEEYYGS